MTVRKYSSRSQQTTLSSPITSTATTMSVVNGSAIMGGKTLTGTQTYTVVIDPDTALEEIVDVTLYSSGNTLTITRGVDGPTPGTGSAHSAGAVVRHMAIGRDYQESNDHQENSTTAHGLTLANVTLSTGIGNVSTAMLASNAVTTAKITDANVTTAKIADSAVTSAKIADLTIATGDIADSAITSGKIATGAVGTTKIDDLSVTTAKIVDSAITSAKIADGTIVAGDIADGAITSAKILDGTIANADINSSAQIAYSKLALTNGIVNADINASAAIDKTKISGTAITAGDSGTVTSTMIADGTIVNADINASAAIDWTKIAPSSTVSATELGYLDGVTSAVQTQLDAKLGTSTAASTYAPLASPALTGVPTAPTAAANTNTTQIATTAYVQAEINELIDAAPGALDTLNELAAAMGDDPNFATTVTNSLATKLALAGGTMSGAIAMGTNKITGLGTPTSSTDAATKAYTDTMLPLAGGTMSGAIAMGTNKITGVGDPTNAQDVVTKYYLDNVVLAPSNLTGVITSVGNVTSIASQTGTGTKFVVDTSPTLVTPVLGVATATSINGTTIPSSKTLVATDSTAYVVPSQTGNSGKALTTDGTTSSWSTTINGTAIPATKTLVDTDSVQTLTNKSLTAPTITGTIALPSTTSIGNVSATEIGYVDGVTSAIQTQLDAKAPTASPTFTGNVASGGSFVAPNDGYVYWGPGDGSTSIQGNSSTDIIKFYTVGSERMRIDGSGNTTINAIAAGTTATAAVGGGYMGMPQNATTTGAYTVAAADAGKHIYSTATRTVTIDSNANLALPVGTVVSFISGAGATTTIAITTDTMYLAGAGTTGSRTLAAHGMATAVKVASTTWYISGNGLT